jgi:hypothetical protein
VSFEDETHLGIKKPAKAGVFMPRKGLEPSRLAALVPEYGAANFILHKELYGAAYGWLTW